MFTLCVSERVSVALRVEGYGLHGHDVEVTACLEKDELDRRGMVYDAEELRRKLQEVLAPLDHSLANEVVGAESVTAELLALWVYKRLVGKVKEARLAYVKVRLGCGVEAFYHGGGTPSP